MDKPVPVRISPLLTSRYLSQRRIRLPARKYHPNNDSPKVRVLPLMKVVNLTFRFEILLHFSPYEVTVLTCVVSFVNRYLQVPFFSDDEETPSTPKADAVFIPRENPRALVIRPIANWPSRASAEKASPLKNASTLVHENGMILSSSSAFLWLDQVN